MSPLTPNPSPLAPPLSSLIPHRYRRGAPWWAREVAAAFAVFGFGMSVILAALAVTS